MLLGFYFKETSQLSGLYYLKQKYLQVFKSHLLSLLSRVSIDRWLTVCAAPKQTYNETSGGVTVKPKT